MRRSSFRIVKRKKEESGIVLMLSAMMLMFIIPMVGLAIDAGTVYAVKARAQSAVDGAALSAARSLSRGLDLASQQSAARDTAIRWFHANIPNGWMNVGTLADPTVTFPAAPPKTTIVNVAGTIQAPTYFMRILNINGVTIPVTGQATRRDVNIVLVLDRSGSLYESGSCQAVADAAIDFTAAFVNGRDRLGMLTFGTDYRVDFPPNMNFATGSPNMVSLLGNLYCYGYTNSAAAYWAAYQELVTIGDQGALNVILFFTDGMPNTLTFGVAPDGTDNRLPAKKLTTPSTVTYGSYNNANRTPCRGANGKPPGDPLWNPGPFTGVLTFASGIYKKNATSYPASQAVDAQKIGNAEGNYTGCIFDAEFNNPSTIYQAGSPQRAIGGPGFSAVFDVAYVPEEDINRNKTGTGYGGASVFATVNRYPGTFPAAYVGKIRVDDSNTLVNAGLNALDYAAQRVRVDSMSRNLNVVTYTVGLGNAPGGIDNSLLQRVANDPDANNYNSSQPSGIYMFAPSTTDLNRAFSRIASDVLRISR